MTSFVIEASDGVVTARGTLETTRAGLTAWQAAHRLPPATPVALETGTLAFFVADELARLGLRPIVVDAHEVRLKAQRPRQKSDRRDAFEICEGLRRDSYRTIVHVPAPALRTLRELLARRRHFVRVQTAQVNAAKRTLRAVGHARLVGSLRTPTAWTRLLTRLDAMPALADSVRTHAAVWEAAQGARATLEAALTQHAVPFAAPLARLQTVPGVGPLVGLTAIAAFADVGRFADAKRAASYAGLVPSTHQSGAVDRHGHITKRGSAELRAMLCEAAHHAARPGHPFHGVFRKLCVRRGYRPAIIAVAHRLCRLLFALLRDGTTFAPARLGLGDAPARHPRVRGLRISAG
jgi:transposase